MADRLPCGCVMDTVDGVFVYEPCSMTCRYYKYVQQQSAAMGLPIRPVIDPQVKLAEPADCRCCAGSVRGPAKALCEGCLVAVTSQGEHPHKLSPAQLAVMYGR